MYYYVTSPKELTELRQCGVYIQDVNGKLWKTEEWDGSVEPNAVAVIDHKCKVLIALKDATPSVMQMSATNSTPFEEYMRSIQDGGVLHDYNGARNTANILKVQPSTEYAAGYCSSFVFPDGKTKGHLPSAGQLCTVYNNKDEVNAALKACGGTAMIQSHYWSSTFWGVDRLKRRSCWIFCLKDCNCIGSDLDFKCYVRPFADLLTVNFL